MIFQHPLTEDTALRLLEPRHAEECFALIDANRARLQIWLDWVERTNSVDDRRAYCKLALEQCAQGRSLVVGIWHRGRFAGTVGLEDINTFAGTAEIGYWLGEEFQGHGLVTNTCRAIIAHAFGTLGLNRLQIRVQPINSRSRAIPQRLGFRREGTLRQVGRILDNRIDLEVYSLLREDWAGAAAPIAFTHPLTDDAELRLVMPQDAEPLFALVEQNREHLRWMIFTEGTKSVEDIRSFIRHTLQEMAEDKGQSVAIVHHGRLAGIFGAGGIDRNSQKVEIGYLVG
ncbi:MAG TPA: GNAT family N-acetyltransferase [Armatimonadota bacterium]